MKRQIEVERHAVNRGHILYFLAIEYPGGLNSVLMRRVLGNIEIALSADALESYLTYLEQIGYITVARIEGEITHAVITPKGLNFVDGLLPEPDPGVRRV